MIERYTSLSSHIAQPGNSVSNSAKSSLSESNVGVHGAWTAMAFEATGAYDP